MRKVNTKGPDNGTRNAMGMGELRVLRRLNKYEFAVELDVMRSGVNNNQWDYRDVEKHYLSFLGTPILVAYVNGRVGDGHNMRERLDPRTGETYQSFTDATSERIVGALSEDPADLTLETKDGQTWLRAKGKLWSFYAPELVEKIVRTGRMEVSAETNVLEGHREGETEVFTDWEGLGVTILGEHVAPAIPGAQIAALAAMKKEFQQLKLRAAALATGRETDPAHQNTSREGVKKSMNKRDVKRLGAKFPEHRIVAMSQDKMTVGLVDRNGTPWLYTFLPEDKGEVVLNRLTQAELTVNFVQKDEGAAPLAADLEEIVDYVSSESAAAAAKCETLEEELNAAKETVETMKQAEHRRRMDAVKDGVKKALEEIASAADDDEDEDDLEEESRAIEENAERYASMEDEDGKFTGAEQARADLMAQCAEKRIQRQKQHKKKKENAFAWDHFGQQEGGGDGIDGMLSRING